MRRLPIYFVIDVSKSNFGDLLGLISDSIESAIRIWRQNPYLLETMYISQLYYDKHGCSISQFHELFDFHIPTNFLNNVKEKSEVLDILMKHIEENVEKSTDEHKGDCRPLILVFSTDTISKSLHGDIFKWSDKFSENTNIIVFDLGEKTNKCSLDEDDWYGKLKLSLNVISPNVIHIKPKDSESFLPSMEFIAQSYAKCACANIALGSCYEYNLESEKIKLTLKFKHP